MKVLTIKQPWATLIMQKDKRFEFCFNLNFCFLIKVLDGKNLSKFYGLGLVEFLYFPLNITVIAVSV